jgi:enoyl-CoA hydratase/carnithine racemase
MSTGMRPTPLCDSTDGDRRTGDRGREATLLVTIDYGEKNGFGVAMMNELADEIRDAAAEPELRFGRLRSREKRVLSRA